MTTEASFVLFKSSFSSFVASIHFRRITCSSQQSPERCLLEPSSATSLRLLCSEECDRTNTTVVFCPTICAEIHGVPTSTSGFEKQAPSPCDGVLGSSMRKSALDTRTSTSHPPESVKKKHVPQKFGLGPSHFFRRPEAHCKKHVPQECGGLHFHCHIYVKPRSNWPGTLFTHHRPPVSWHQGNINLVVRATRKEGILSITLALDPQIIFVSAELGSFVYFHDSPIHGQDFVHGLKHSTCNVFIN